MNVPLHALASLYRSREDDLLRQRLGAAYQPPEIFEHGRETLVAQMPAENEEGLAVRVFETRAPAAFYTIEAGPYRLRTGSGEDMGDLAAAIAITLAAGMLGIEVPEAQG